MKVLQPPEWPRPPGYSNGIAAQGQTIFVAGQIGWDASGRLATGLTAQVEQALSNILTVLAQAGAGPQHVTRLTWFVTDIDQVPRTGKGHWPRLPPHHGQALPHHVGDRRQLRWWNRTHLWKLKPPPYLPVG